jgi:two-component system nitrate/nitrite sensor histidine kinase NarX
VDSIHVGLFNARHAIRLQLFAEQAAIAIQNARTNEKAKRVAMLEERQRLARNLHDAVSQTLFSANIIAENIPLLWQTNPDEVQPRLQQIRTLTQGALAEMRTLLLELHPERLLETKISILLSQLVEGVLGQTYLNVKLNIEENLELPSTLHEAVYYITQESLNNVVKHADANRVLINLQRYAERVELVICDNGCGFDPQQTAPKNFGLYNIRQRAQTTSANLEIKSVIGEGTQISVNWII